MHITGIIAEYNPLHAGHQFHIAQTRQKTGADYLITVLSGDFVQRGEPALLDKHTRARMALEAGSDLVLELPVHYALSSGEGFGFGGVSLLHGLGCVDSLSFGSEEGILGNLIKLAKALHSLKEGSPLYEQFQTAYRTAAKNGLTPPAARVHALKLVYPDLDLSPLDGNSNNMLALEYCNALLRLNSDILPVTIKRKGQAYLSDSACGEFASATAIRRLLQNGQAGQSLNGVCSPFVQDALQQALARNRLIFPADLDALLHYKLLPLSKEELYQYREIDQAFANKVLKQLPDYTGFTQFANLLWTKDTTYARVCRNLLHILLEMKESDWDVRRPVPYARVLGFRKSAAPLLNTIKKSSSIPLITKVADAPQILSPEGNALFQADILASHIYDGVLQHKSHIKLPHEARKQIIII